MLFALSLVPTVASANEVNNVYDGETLTAIKNGNKLLIEDKKTGETVTIELENNSNGKIIQEDGTVEEFKRNADGDIYVDGQLEVAAEENRDKELNPTTRASKWIYVQTYKYNTTTRGNMRSLALGILSFMPYVGPIYGVIGIIDAARSLGAKTLYVRVKQYRTKGYQFYKYDSYFYSNAKLTKLIKKTSKTKKMW
ncbi:hypothetical protein HB912_03650 [Listeria aquatica]|uniref:Uncharacterized protein n=2 Tax=Listeria aquatica TaxID=1494960 RepID=A0A841ZML7_9LIST|nr:hypothetical protein [Listeria aquatica]